MSGWFGREDLDVQTWLGQTDFKTPTAQKRGFCGETGGGIPSLRAWGRVPCSSETQCHLENGDDTISSDHDEGSRGSDSPDQKATVMMAGVIGGVLASRGLSHEAGQGAAHCCWCPIPEAQRDTVRGAGALKCLFPHISETGLHSFPDSYRNAHRLIPTAGRYQTSATNSG